MLSTWRQAIQANLDAVESYQTLGEALEDQGKLDEAIAAYRQAIEIEPKYAPAYVNLGAVLEEEGKLDEAIAAWRTAIEIGDPNLAAVAALNLGNALNQQEKLDEAIAVYQKVLELQPNPNYLAYIHYELGYALTGQNKLEEALVSFQKVLELKPDNNNIVNPYFCLGDALSDEGKLDEAIAAYRQAIELDPQNADAYNNLGWALHKQGKLDDAIAAYQQAIQLNPHDARFYNNLGFILQKQGKFEEAIKRFQQALVDENEGSQFYLKETERLLALQQNPQLFTLPEKFPNQEEKILVSLKRSVVRIIVKNPSFWGGGTGWVVKTEKNKAWIVTNRHVVTEEDEQQQYENIEVEFYSEPPSGQFRQRCPAQIVKMTSSEDPLDLALLEVTDIPEDIQPLTISLADVFLHTSIRIIGYSITGNDWTVLTGEVNHKTDQALHLSASVTKGISGSPVLDQQSLVVGVVFQAKFRQNETKIKDVSLAISMQSVTKQLDSWQIC